MSDSINRLRANRLLRQLDDIQIHGVSAGTIKEVGTGLEALTEVLATAQQGKTDAANKKAATDARAAATTADNAAQLAAMTASASPTLANQQAALAAQQNAATLDAAAAAAEAKAGTGAYGQGGQGQGQYPGAPGQGQGQYGQQYPGGPGGPKKPMSVWIPVAIGVGVLGVGFLLYTHFSNASGGARGYARKTAAAS